MGFGCRHRNLLLAGAALLWGLAHASPAALALAQQTTAPAANASKASTDKEQCAQGQAGDQPNTTPKSGSDGQSDEKSKKETTPPAYKLLRYEEDYSYLKDPSRRSDFWDPIKYIPLCGREDWYVSFDTMWAARYPRWYKSPSGRTPVSLQTENEP